MLPYNSHSNTFFGYYYPPGLEFREPDASHPKNDEKKGHWSEKQNIKYYAFLKKFQSKFIEKEQRREWKVFKIMSEFMRTRNANQCRSHHYKMKGETETIQQILQYLKTKVFGIDKKSKKYQEELSNISFNEGPNPSDKNNLQSSKEGAEVKAEEDPGIQTIQDDKYYLQQLKQQTLLQCHHYFLMWWQKFGFFLQLDEIIKS